MLVLRRDYLQSKIHIPRTYEAINYFACKTSKSYFQLIPTEFTGRNRQQNNYQ